MTVLATNEIRNILRAVNIEEWKPGLPGHVYGEEGQTVKAWGMELIKKEGTNNVEV